MTELKRVLVVDDEKEMRAYLRTLLRSAGFRIIEAETQSAAVELAAKHQPHLIVLDLGLPDGDGLEVTRIVREWSEVPIIVVSAREHEDDKVLALDLGADDYLVKPFGSHELLARVRVALRHSERREVGAAVVEVGELRIDLSHAEVTLAGQRVHLTRHEYGLIRALARHVGKVVTHGALLDEVWGPQAREHTHYVRVYMAHLRKKLEDDPSRPRYLKTVTGVGYRLDEP